MADRDITTAAEELGIPRSWLRDSVTARTVPHHRYGKHVRFTDEDMAQLRARTFVAPISTARNVVPLAPRRRRAAA